MSAALGLCHNACVETLEAKAGQASAAKANTTGKAVRAAIMSAGCFSLMFAFIKLLGKGYPSGEILFSRSFFALIPLMPVIIRNGGFQVFRTQKPWQHATRSTLGLISAFLCIEAIKLLPLAEATSLFYAAPIVTTLLALAFLNERITRGKATAIVTGFFGVLYMLQPRLSSNFAGAILALASAVSSAFVYIELRRMAATEKSVTIVLYFMLACSIAGLATMPFQFVMPGPHDALILLLIGVFGGIAQILMTEAYALAPATTVAPLSYLSLIWAVLLDLLLWGHKPNPEALVGALIIAVSGIVVVAAGKNSTGSKDEEAEADFDATAEHAGENSELEKI